jgi:hypothetical protein
LKLEILEDYSERRRKLKDSQNLKKENRDYFKIMQILLKEKNKRN